MGKLSERYCPLVISSGTSFERNYPDGVPEDVSLEFDDRLIKIADSAAILSAFDDPHGVEKNQIIVAVTHIVINFRIHMQNKSAGIIREKIKTDLDSFISSAEKLSKFSENQELIAGIILTEQREKFDRTGSEDGWQQPDMVEFWGLLDRLLKGAEAFIRRDDAIRYLSASSPSGKNKGDKRLLIWEPFIELWRATGRTLGLSDNGYGPLMRGMTAIHRACSLEKPSVSSIREVVNSIKAQPLAGPGAK